MSAYPTAAFTPTEVVGSTEFFHTDKRSCSLSDTIDNLVPLGVRLRKDPAQVVAFQCEDTGQIRLAIGWLYRWENTGLTFAWARSNTTETQKKALLAAAERAALEPDFLKGSWKKLRATKERGPGQYAAISVSMAEPTELELALRSHLLAVDGEFVDHSPNPRHHVRARQRQETLDV